MSHEGVIPRREIRALAERMAREFEPESIILFGSYAGGDPTQDSDVDLLVVLPHQGKDCRMAAEIRGRIRPSFPSICSCVHRKRFTADWPEEIHSSARLWKREKCCMVEN